jgi:hypothetical protein
MKNFYQTLLLTILLLGFSKIDAQVPVLNSYPTAPAVIYLDFDGQTLSGTSWNANGPLYLGPSNLSDAQITEVFNRVAEDYRPFNINITTDSTKYWAAPARQRMRVIMTISYEWYGRAGGVAYVNSFTWGDNTPCFVFTSLLNYNAKNIAEAGSHEAGHTLGLRHQARYDNICQKTEEYNSGVGSGEIGWAPIMGVGYYRNQTTWHNGPNPYGCTNAQDDLAIITSTTNGFGLRTDDHDATTRKATAVTLNKGQFKNEGLINASTDEDMFAITMPIDGEFRMDVKPYGTGNGDAGSNLDVNVKLYDSKQRLLNTYNQPELLSASIDTVLNSGTYYVSVGGTSNAYTTNYASLGAYTLEGSYGTFTVLPLRQLELKGQTDGSTHKLNWIVDADEAIVSQVLEVSPDGRSFQTVAAPASTDRNYSYTTTAASILQYRLKVTFSNGRTHYSNVIALRNSATMARPQLYSNLIRSGSIMLTSPSIYSYTITDYSGRTVGKGTTSKGASSIPVGGITNGSYLIVFTNGQEQYVEKFLKQ